MKFSNWLHGEDRLKEVARHFENYHFIHSTSLQDYINAETTKKHILQRVAEMKNELQQCF